MPMIWFTSDLHFNHDREFIWKPRGFSCVEDMNHAIVERYNSVVGKDDIVYILGDPVLGRDLTAGVQLVNSLNGHKFVVAGNHDTTKRRAAYEAFGWHVCDATTLKYNGYHFYLSHYPTLTANNDFDKPLKARIINLCGHYHTNDPFIDMRERNMLSYHVEVDSHNCFPVSIDTVIDNIQNFLGTNVQSVPPNLHILQK